MLPGSRASSLRFKKSSRPSKLLRKQKDDASRNVVVMPLRQLKALRDDNCSQAVTDLAIGWLEAHRPDLIENLMLHGHWQGRNTAKRPGIFSNF